MNLLPFYVLTFKSTSVFGVCKVKQIGDRTVGSLIIFQLMLDYMQLNHARFISSKYSDKQNTFMTHMAMPSRV